MLMSMIADIESGIRSFFSSLAASLSFNLIFILGILVQILIIAFFAIKSEFAYELRMSKAFDKLNRWLFVNKRLSTDNIKEFSNMIKKAPKRLAYNWQQYILYREKSPSEYMSVENCIDKPLKASSLSANIRNMTIISIFWAFFVFGLGLIPQYLGDTMLNVPVLMIALLTPTIIILLYIIAAISLRARKNSNLDLLYQNHHLFQRFIDNACVDLPTFIDYSLLFTTEEIEKGIPALREYLENRARKEKEEFEKAKREAVVYEQYNFEDAGIDGSNILERAMNESEAYLNKKEKTLAKISQLEASLDSLKRNYINLEKDYQKAMQVSKENIDRLRQQQEETTSRIEGNFLRKQQSTEITKQEKIESDFEQQRRKFNIESKDYEEAIKNLQTELENGKSVAEDAMLSEYQSFYERICKAAHEQMRSNVKQEIINLRSRVESGEDELAVAQTTLKRLQDENDTLRRKLDLEPAKLETPVVEEKVEKPVKEEKPVDVFLFDDIIEEPKEEKKDEIVKTSEAPKESKVETLKNDQSSVFIFDDEPVKEAPVKAPKPKGRPKKVVQEKPESEKRGRGRPVGSTNKTNSPSMKKRATGKAKQSAEPSEKRGRGRPPKKKDGDVSQINQKIDEETKRIKDLQATMNSQIEEAIHGLEEVKREDNIDTLLSQISDLKKEAERLKDSTDIDGMNAIEKKIEELLTKIKDING